MNIELNNEGNKYSFDVDSNKGIDYLTKIAIKVFDLQANSFNLSYNNRLLPKEDIPLKDIFKHHSSLICVKIEAKTKKSPSSFGLKPRAGIRCSCTRPNASSFCSTCDQFLCLQCLQNHSQSHQFFSLEKGINSVVNYQKSLFSRLNSLSSAYKNNSKNISDLNENIIDVLEQSKASIGDILQRIALIQSSIETEARGPDEAAVTSLKCQIVSNYGDGSSLVVEDSIQKAFKELCRVERSIIGLESRKTLIRLQTRFLSKVQQYSMIIVNNVNDLLNQLNEIALEREEIVRSLNVFISSNNKKHELSDRLKLKERDSNAPAYSISPIPLSPICYERHIHEHFTSEEASSLLYLNQNLLNSNTNNTSLNHLANVNSHNTTEANQLENNKAELINQLNLSKQLLSRNKQIPLNSIPLTVFNAIDSNTSLKKKIRINTQLTSSYSKPNGINILIGNNGHQTKELNHPQSNRDSNKAREGNLIPVQKKNQFRSSYKSLSDEKYAEDNPINGHLLSSLAKTEKSEETRKLINNLKVIPGKKLLTIKEFPCETKAKKSCLKAEDAQANCFSSDNRNPYGHDQLTTINNHYGHTTPLNEASANQQQNPLEMTLSRINSKSNRKKRRMINKYDFLI